MVKNIPPWAMVGGIVFLGAFLLVWHAYANDDDDPDWTTPKETQPSAQEALCPTKSPCGTSHGYGRPMAVNVAFRGRASLPASLTADSDSIIGEC